jgi:hypothetical protein
MLACAQFAFLTGTPAQECTDCKCLPGELHFTADAPPPTERPKAVAKATPQPRPVASSAEQQQQQQPAGEAVPAGDMSATWPARPATWTRKHWPPRVLIMTVATHREPFIDLVEESVRKLGGSMKLYVAGDGEFFRGYGWKLKRVRQTLLEFQV